MIHFVQFLGTKFKSTLPYSTRKFKKIKITKRRNKLPKYYQAHKRQNFKSV